MVSHFEDRNPSAGGDTGSPRSPRSVTISRRDGLIRDSDTMSDEPIPGNDPPKTATDLAIEKLTAELEQLKKDHAEQVRQLEDANKSLWAAAHPAPAQVTVPEPAPSAGFDYDKATDAFYDALGKKKE